MSLTKNFHEQVQRFLAEKNRINREYVDELDGLKRFEGSAGYSEDVKSAEQARNKALAALRQEYAPRFDSILNSMATAAQAQPMTAPTQDQLATLEVMKMRERLTRDELQKAMNSMADCPVALGVLRELAKKHEIIGVGVTVEGATMDTEQALHTIDIMRRSCKALLSGETTYTTMNIDGAGLTAIINKMAAFPNTVVNVNGFQRVEPNAAAVAAFCKAVDG